MDWCGQAGYAVSVVALKKYCVGGPLLTVVATKQCWMVVDTVSAVLPQATFQVNWSGSHSLKNLIFEVSQIYPFGLSHVLFSHAK